MIDPTSWRAPLRDSDPSFGVLAALAILVFAAIAFCAHAGVAAEGRQDAEYSASCAADAMTGAGIPVVSVYSDGRLALGPTATADQRRAAAAILEQHRACSCAAEAEARAKVREIALEIAVEREAEAIFAEAGKADEAAKATARREAASAKARAAAGRCR